MAMQDAAWRRPSCSPARGPRLPGKADRARTGGHLPRVTKRDGSSQLRSAWGTEMGHMGSSGLFRTKPDLQDTTMRRRESTLLFSASFAAAPVEGD
ncbi:MAG: hypothetical protein WAW52_13635 [Methanothrix sp.]